MVFIIFPVSRECISLEQKGMLLNQGIALRVMNYFRDKSTENNKIQQIGKLAAYKTLISWVQC